MNEADKKQLSDYLEQMERFNEQTQRKKPEKLKAVAQYLNELNWIAQAYGMKNVSRSLIIGLSTAFRGIKKSESGLGIFSDDFEACAETIAAGIAKMSLKKSDMPVIRLLKWYIEIAIIGVVGLLHLTEQPKKQATENEEIDESEDHFRNELILNLFFHTEYPNEVFYQMAETLDVKEGNRELIKEVLQGVVLIAALMGFSQGTSTIDEQLLRSLIPRLSHCLDKIAKRLTEINVSEDESVAIRAFLRQTKLAFEQQDIEASLNTFREIFESYGFDIEALKEDIKEIKEMFDTYVEAYTAKNRQQVMTVDVIG